MAEDVKRKLSEQDKALAAEFGRGLPENVKDLPTRMPGAPTHTPNAKEAKGGGVELYRSLDEDQKGPKGTLAARLTEHREKQQARSEPAKTQEQGRER